MLEDVGRKGRPKPSARQLEIRLVSFYTAAWPAIFPKRSRIEPRDIDTTRVLVLSCLELWPADNKKVEPSIPFKRNGRSFAKRIPLQYRRICELANLCNRFIVDNDIQRYRRISLLNVSVARCRLNSNSLCLQIP